jgi:mannose-6-phosphate isomerase
MFVGIRNTPRDYAWGSRTAIAELLGTTASGRPEAELWLGSHPGSPAVLVSPREAGGTGTLDGITTLPFLLKVLAADSPLSLQAHPSPAQAIDGFARENSAGIPLDSPSRNYKDDRHKPELIFAVSDEFSALCGFRSVAATRELLLAEPEFAADPTVANLLDRLVDDASLPSTFEWLIAREAGVDELVARVVELASKTASTRREFETVVALSLAFPGDPGIVISLLLNHVVLRSGEVLYLPAGNIHAYLRGVGIELMAASDNVLRGGLTVKHVDVDELLTVLDFRPYPAAPLAPITLGPHAELFAPPVSDFALAVFTPTAADDSVAFGPAGPSIALCTDGELTVEGSGGKFSLAQGDAVYISADEGELSISGAGTMFLATTGRSA